MPSDLKKELNIFREEVSNRIAKDAEYLATLTRIHAELALENILDEFNSSAVVMHCLLDDWTENDRDNFAASKKRYYLLKLIAALETCPNKDRLLPLIRFMIDEEGNCPEEWYLK